MKLPDEPVLEKNVPGSISFVRSGKETRDIQLYINIRNNSPRLDTIDFAEVVESPPVGKVISGMEVVESLYSAYENEPDQNSTHQFGNSYLRSRFTELDYIKEVKIINKK